MAPGLLEPRTSVGRFTIVRLLGTGGMGAVYEALDSELDRSVAIKVLHELPGGAGALRMAREAKALAQLAHPNVVSVYDVGETKAGMFIAMEHVVGRTLGDHLAERPHGWAEIAELFLQAARGLAAAHARSLVHRDFKPANVLVDREGRVRVADFGLARVVGDSAEEPPAPGPPDASLLGADLTATGAVLGTPRYMSPEQRAGQPATARSDQYSFCCAFWEALHGDLPPVRRRRVPGWLARALETGLAASPADRHASMGELIEILERAPAHRRRLALVGGAALLAAGSAAAVLGLGLGRGVDCERVGAPLAAVWDDAARARVRGAFAATGRPHAPEVFARVDAALNQRAEGARAARIEACAATHVRGEQSEALLDRRNACLARAERQIAELVEAWQHGPVDLERAVRAAVSVGDAAGCADLASLDAPVPPAARARVDEQRAALDQIAAQQRAGQLAPALARARLVTAAARELAFPPLLAEALLVEGTLECEEGKLDEGLAILGEAALAAGTARDDARGVEALTELIFYTGARAQRLAEAEALMVPAEAALARAGGRDDLRAKLLDTEGDLLDSLGKYPAAVERLGRALALSEKVRGPGHLETAQVKMHLASATMGLPKLPEALALYEEAIAAFERVVGPDHPQIASALSNMAIIQQQLGDYDRAAAAAERSLAIREKLLRPDHPQIAYSLVNLATSRRYQGRGGEARRLLERAAAIRERELGADHPLYAAVLRALAEVELAEGQHARARDLLDRNLVIMRAKVPAESPAISLALSMRGTALLRLGDLAGARADFLEALAACRKRDDRIYISLPLVGLGELALVERRPASALPLFREAVAALEAGYGKDSPYLVGALRGLGQAELDLGHADAALEPLERAVRLADPRDSAEEAERAKVQLARARALTRK